MAKELVLDVVAKKNSKDLQLLALEFDKLAASVDNSNKSAKQSVTFSKFLDDQIVETRKQVQQLQQEFNQTGSADIFSQLRGSQRNLDSLTRIRKQLGDVDSATEETKHELSGLDAEVQKLSTRYFELTRDALAPAEAEFAKLTDRQKTQAETVKILQQRYRETGDAFRELDLLNARRDMERLDAEVEHFGGSLEALRRAAPDQSNFTFGRFVESEISRARTEVDKLRTDLNKGGGINVFKDLGKAEGDLKTLETIGKDIGVAVESGVEDGAQQGVKFLGQAFGSLPPEAQAGIAAGVAGAILIGGPAIGAALGGVLLSGVGLAGIGGAIALQIKDPRVAAELSGLKTLIVANLTQATSSFAPALIDGADKLGAAFTRVEPVLERGFEAIAGPADRLFTGIGGFIENLAPGLSKGLQGAGVVIDELAADLPGLGHDFSQFFALLGDGGVGGADAIGKIIHAVGILVVATGAELDLLSGVFTALEISADLASGKFTEAATKMAELNGGFHDGADSATALNGKLGSLGSTAGNAASMIDSLNQRIDTFINKSLSADDAAIRYQQALDDLATSIQQNGNNWDINTEAGRKNQQTLLDGIQAAEQRRQAEIAAGGDALAAAKEYNQEVESLLNIAAKGGDAKAALDALKGKYEIDVSEYYTTHFINEGTPPSQFFHGLAAGGPVTAGQPYIVGENGPELFMSDTSGQIIPNDKLKNLSGSTPPPNFRANSVAASGAVLVVGAGGDTALASFLQGLVRTGVLQLQAA